MLSGNLLSHTSGIPNLPANFDFQKNYTEDQLLTLITKEKLEFPPGEKFWLDYRKPQWTQTHSTSRRVARISYLY